MSPEYQRKIDELYEDLQRRKLQQIAFPLDEASKESIGIYPFRAGTTALTQALNGTDSRGDTFSVTVPKAYTGSEIISVNGKLREFPYIA